MPAPVRPVMLRLEEVAVLVEVRRVDDVVVLVRRGAPSQPDLVRQRLHCVQSVLRRLIGVR